MSLSKYCFHRVFQSFTFVLYCALQLGQRLMWYKVGYKLLVLLAACCCCRWPACYPQTSPFYDDRGHTAPRPRGVEGGSLSIRCQGPPLLSPTHLISRLPSPPPDSRQEARCPLSHIAYSTTFISKSHRATSAPSAPGIF